MASISPQVLTAYDQLLEHEGLKYQIFKINDVDNEVVVDDFGDEVGADLGYQVKDTATEEEDRAAFQEFVERINNYRTRSPRYCLFSFGSNGSSKLAFIYWSPIGAVMLSKMLYNSTKADIAEAFSKASKVIQVKDSSRLLYDDIKQQASQENTA